MMGKHYQKRPSEILNIDDGYLAYCIDEVAYYLELEAMDEKGNINWNKIKWKDELKKSKNNNDLINFIRVPKR